MKSFSTFRYTALMAAMLLIMPATHATGMQQPTISKMSAVGSQETDAYDKFIVSYREGSGIRNNPTEVVKDVQFAITTSGVDRVTSSSKADAQPLTVIYKRKLGVGAELVQTSHKLDMAEANALMQKIATNPDVVYVEPDRKLRIDEVSLPTFPSFRADLGSKASSIAPLVFNPDDPYYQNDRQWNFRWPGISSANIDHAWDLADGTGVTVVVIDTGMAPNPDSNDDFVCEGYNFSKDDADYGKRCGWDPGHPRGTSFGPSSWHGTKVAGIINARTNNGMGLAGVAYGAKLIPLRTAAYDGAYDSDISDSIEWASGGHVDGFDDIERPAQVINISIGSYFTNPCATPNVIGLAVQRAIARNVVLVASAGNESRNSSDPNDPTFRGYHLPSTCPGVIAVAATDYSGNRAVYSNYGAAVALAVPAGDGIGNPEQMYYEWSWMLSNSGEYEPVQDTVPKIAPDAGTSYAAPLVTGTVALMISARQREGLPSATPAQIRDWLTSSTDPITPDKPIGSGVLDAHKAVVTAITK
ncbi:S8 family serine peptidase [Dyella nitratireducens]|uniref:Protease n=1 Tax=Dyella nitratireducens TaxID=1849580 RepID=A0ABQ1FZP1_9GAMM|nr:S8 family serine peptidase [Dyella nitratireducens]GGA34064.1 protease [Dyella nitratireducens]GLQ40810.1 protease [Dyella nitratireducens]